ncbi:substrate-binding domain-containing protein, partial [Streptomyces sp. NPDC006552]|uniref:substrate-binding domain-containing protein n=1 Tax=Streptomyces sp. NPDC006552 TaxID=3157179 RepID=UPI00339F4020
PRTGRPRRLPRLRPGRVRLRVRRHRHRARRLDLRLDVAAGRDAGARLLGLADRPTAVFCANDLLALGVLQALYAAGVKVPDAISIVGYDDIEFAAAATVPLTSVRRPAHTLGTVAAQLLLQETGEHAAGHRHQRVVLRPELVVRGSSRALPGA